MKPMRRKRLTLDGARRFRDTKSDVSAGRRAGPSPYALNWDGYQSNFAPNRNSRGGTIVVGCWKVDPELQLMFWAGLVLVRL